MRFGLDLPPHYRVFGSFFLYAFGMGGIFPRMADIQHALGVTQGTFGLALIGTATGTLISLTFAAPLIERLGHRLMLALIPLLTLLFAAASFATGPVALFLLLLPTGIVIGCIEIIVNLEADRVEHQLGRRIMNRSHAFWSLGFFTAGLVGATFAQLGVSPQLDLLLMVPVILAGVLVVLGRFESAPHRATAHTDPPPRFARPTAAILILVVVTLSAMILEGAGSDWSAIYMRDEFGAAPFIIGFAAAVGAMVQGATRFFADGFVERYSPSSVARALLSVLGIGALTVFFAPSDWVALFGLGLLGMGTSVIFPLAMSAAAQRTDRAAAINVAALAQISFVAFLFGPPLLGFVAQHFGVRWSFGIALPLVVLSLWAAGSLGRRPMVTLAEPIPGE
ncbi:MAG TPA: MFS transporter [Devosiaceae bacterium]|nr:MFS transporter [Devosiaceae bacterium]